MTDSTCIPADGTAAATTATGALPPLPDFQNTELWPLLLRWSNAATGAPKLAAAAHVEGTLGRLMRDYAGAVIARVGTLPPPDDGRGEPEREAFEAWVVEFDCGPNLDRTACFYDSFNVQRAWAAWQASAVRRGATVAPTGPPGPTDPVLVPHAFVQAFNTLAHNYSLRAVPPDYYDGRAGDAFSNAYARCGKDLADLRSLLLGSIGLLAARPSGRRD